MKKIFTLAAVIGLTLLGSSSVFAEEDASGTCYVTFTYVNPETGESYKETYYSTSRTSEADCRAGAEALASGDIMTTGDFQKSPVIFDPNDR